MDKYSTRIGKILAYLNKQDYAITLGQTTYYSCAKHYVTRTWRKHEDRHKQQWAEVGVVKFAVRYLWYSWKYGYWNNPFEKDAREYSCKSQ